MDKELDLEFLDFLARKIVQEETTGKFVQIPDKINLIDSCELILRRSIEGASITKLIGDPFPSMGCIELVGKKVVIKDVENFVAVSKVASNINIFSLTNGNVEIDFTFHGIAQKIG